MFSTIQEGLEVYKASLLKYKEWIEKESQTDRTTERLGWHQFMDGLATGLGLTQDEEISIMKEVGFHPEREEPPPTTQD